MNIGYGFSLINTVVSRLGVATYVFEDDEEGKYKSTFKISACRNDRSTGGCSCGLSKETVTINGVDVQLAYTERDNYANFETPDYLVSCIGSNMDTETWFDVLSRVVEITLAGSILPQH